LAGNAPQVGRLKSVTTSAAATVYAHDALGRVTASTQTVTGSAYSYGFLYTWLLNDGLATMRYPSGRTLTYAQDDAGRVIQVQDGVKPYGQGMNYTAHGAIAQMQLGNGLVEQWLYNSRLQPVSIRLGDVAGSDSAFGVALDYGSTGNNGNLAWQRITGSGLDRTQTYQYDGVNRLIGSGELAVWSRNFGYDQQGNGWVSSWSAMSPSSFTPVSSNWFNAQNRLTGMGATYDAAGNQLAIGGYGFTYDAENRQKTSTIDSATTTYFYDGEGRRVKKLLPNGDQTLFIYDAMGQLAAEYTTDQFAHSGTRYLTVDHLGSIRAVTSQEKTVLARRDYLPFGEEIPPPLGGRTSVWAADAGFLQKFTGKERDAETVLDYFGARYFSGAQGRFTSPDPLLNSGRPWEPESWNRYAYALNNPLKYTDPLGLYEWAASGCAEDDEKCLKQCQQNQESFRRGLTNLEKAKDAYKKGSREYNRLDAALKAYGKENDPNGVTVGFATLSGSAEGRTIPENNLASFRVLFDPQKIEGAATAWAITTGHEGTHVSDFRLPMNDLRLLTPFSVEYRGYETSALTFQGVLSAQGSRGTGELSYGKGSNRVVIWNTGWAAADRETLRDKGITKHVLNAYGHPETKIGRAHV